jgi:hypothetical protein
MKILLAGLFFLGLLTGCAPDNHRVLGTNTPMFTGATAAPSGYSAGNSPYAPYMYDNTTGAVLMDVGSGTITLPAAVALSGTVSTTPASYQSVLSATSGTSSTITAPASAKTATFWGSGTLSIGGGTVTTPTNPTKIDMTSGGTLGVSSGSVNVIFGG